MKNFKKVSPFKITLAILFISVMFISGCVSKELLPAEDLEVFDLCSSEIAILHSSDIKPNSKEKYEAAKSMLEKVDFSFMRQANTIDKIFYYGDAVVSDQRAAVRTFAFNYQYEDNYIRFIFTIDKTLVLRTEVQEK